MITSEYREALEQFTLRYNELTGIFEGAKGKRAEDRPEESAVAGTKAGDCRTERKDDGSRKAAGTLERRGSRVQ
mgnify:CR=1 FL=1